MSDHSITSVPHVDETTDLAVIRDQAERIAVPNFDWIGEPIAALVDGLTGHGPHHDDPPPAAGR